LKHQRAAVGVSVVLASCADGGGVAKLQPLWDQLLPPGTPLPSNKQVALETIYNLILKDDISQLMAA
jgi:hypothetical protein